MRFISFVRSVIHKSCNHSKDEAKKHRPLANHHKCLQMIQGQFGVGIKVVLIMQNNKQDARNTRANKMKNYTTQDRVQKKFAS